MPKRTRKTDKKTQDELEEEILRMNAGQGIDQLVDEMGACPPGGSGVVGGGANPSVSGGNEQGGAGSSSGSAPKRSKPDELRYVK